MAGQTTEARIGVTILNRMVELGMPESVAIRGRDSAQPRADPGTARAVQQRPSAQARPAGTRRWLRCGSPSGLALATHGPGSPADGPVDEAELIGGG